MHLEADRARVILTVCCLVQQKPGRRLSSRAPTPRSTPSVTRQRSGKDPVSLHFIPDHAILSNETEPENHMQSEEHPSHEWPDGFDALTASRSPLLNATTEDTSYFCRTSLESSLDSSQTHIEQLAKLVITIGPSVSTLSSPAGRPSLSASSPPFKDVCASASLLIKITDQVSQPDIRKNEPDVSMLELDSQFDPIPAFDYIPSYTPTDKPAGQGALLNPGTLLMILACYQRLLDAFETICLFMQQRLHEMEMSSLIGLSEQRWCRSISPPSQSPPSDILQFIMMIKLTSDLLNRLDRAQAPLVSSVEKANSDEVSGAGLHCHDISPGPSSSSSSSSSIRRLSSRDSSDRTPALINGDVSTESGRTEREVRNIRSTSNILIMKSGEQLRQQQSRLHTLIKVVKKLVRSQKV